MRRLTIVRHAHAEGLAPGAEDFERRLDAKGRREAEAIAERAARLQLAPDHLIASPADRTAATARTLARTLGFPLSRIRHDDRVYLAERPTLVEVLRAIPAECRRAMLVAHNPGASELVDWLTGDARESLVTGGVVVLEGELANWRALAPGVLRVAEAFGP